MEPCRELFGDHNSRMEGKNEWDGIRDGGQGAGWEGG